MTREHAKLICCILQRGAGVKLLRALHEERGIASATLQHARGESAARAQAGAAPAVEKDLVAIVVPAERADETFSFVYERGDIGGAEGGFMYMANLGAAAAFVLPDLPMER